MASTFWAWNKLETSLHYKLNFETNRACNKLVTSLKQASCTSQNKLKNYELANTSSLYKLVIQAHFWNKSSFKQALSLFWACNFWAYFAQRLQAQNKLNNYKLVIIMELTHYSPNHSRSKNPSVVIGKQKWPLIGSLQFSTIFHVVQLLLTTNCWVITVSVWNCDPYIYQNIKSLVFFSSKISYFKNIDF